MLKRRGVLAGAALASIGIDCDGATAASLVDLSSLGKALGDAADAIGKLGDSIAHLTSLGVQGWTLLRHARLETGCETSPPA